MKISMTTLPAISVAAWLRRYATALIVIALVLLVTLGVGIAQALYANPVLRMSVSEASVNASVTLDQHERRTLAR